MSDDNLSNEILAFIDGNHGSVATEETEATTFADPDFASSSQGQRRSTKKSKGNSIHSTDNRKRKNTKSRNLNSDSGEEEEDHNDDDDDEDREVEEEVGNLFDEGNEDENSENNLSDASSFLEDMSPSSPKLFPSSSAPAISSQEAKTIEIQDENEEEDEDDEDKWDSDLMGDESDREFLESLPELEREKILNERAEKRQMLLERKALKKKLRESGLAVFEDPTRRSNKSKSAKRQKLEALKGRREAKKRKHETDSMGTRSIQKDTWGVSESDSFNEKFREDNEETISPSEELKFDFTLEHLHKMQLSRNNIKKWCFASFFEKVAIGSFVRINVGEHNSETQYRVALVKDIQKYKRNYRIDGLLTNKAFLLVHGGSERQFLGDIFSNQLISDSEFKRWRHTCIKESVSLPTEKQYQSKLQDLYMAQAHVFSDQEISEILKAKQALSKVPRSSATEKAELLKQRDIHLCEGQLDLVKEIDSKLEKLRDVYDAKPLPKKTFPSLTSTSQFSKIVMGSAESFNAPNVASRTLMNKVELDESRLVPSRVPSPSDLLREDESPEFAFEPGETFQDLVSSVGLNLDIDI